MTLDRRLFAEGLEALAQLFNVDLSEPVVALYYAVARDLTDAQWKEVCLRAVADRKHMPRPSELLELAHGTKDDAAALAWAQVMKAMKRFGRYASIDFGDPAIHAAIRSMGGWSLLCLGRLEDLHYRRRDFIDGHRLYSERGVTDEDARHIAGLDECAAIAYGTTYTDSIKQLGTPERLELAAGKDDSE